jgi:hypothetical protein
MERIFCIKHEESTPSLVVYETHAYCYGGCGRIELSELGGKVAEMAPKERYVENLKEKMEYIRSLPKKKIRGFDLPFDNLGYYLVWPDSDYYKLRVWNPDAKDKYRGPAGHAKPVFWARRGTSGTLVLVEGEANSLSMAEAFPEWDVMSPGSASDFKTPKFSKSLLTFVRYYRTVIIQTDRDGPGTEAAIHTKGLLLNKVPHIPIVLMERDANEIYCGEGKEKLREEVLRHLPRM